MSIYCFSCCDYCKEHEACPTRNGGCEKCGYWVYGECINPKIYKNMLMKTESKISKTTDYATPNSVRETSQSVPYSK